MIPATPPTTLQASLETLARNRQAWLAVPLIDKVAYLRSITHRFLEVSDDLVADALAAKGLDPSYAGEEWVSGPVSFFRTCRFLAESLAGIARTGRVPIADGAIGEGPDGRVTIDVMPGDRWDRIQYRGWTGRVWMEPGIPLAEARDHLGSFYTKPGTATAAVAVVLGAGNVASIAPLDLVHKLFVEGHVVLVKFSPVNEYIGPHVEHAFAPLVDAGFVRFAYGGSEVGGYLVSHPLVDEVHITGSEHTHDLIVFGSGHEGVARKARNEPRLTKRVTSELGNVSPVVVVPGDWSRRALAWQAHHVATQVVQNAGYNCNAGKVVIVSGGWRRRDDFIEAVAAAMASRPERPAYYPGSEARYERMRIGAPLIRELGPRRDGVIPPTILEGFGPDDDAPVFTEEAFCQVVAVVDLAETAPGRFLAAAVDFCNERLRGSLNATIIVDPRTAGSPDTAVARAADRLQYGSVGINVWAAAAFSLGVTPWGAYPGHRLDDVRSGIGFVHNARLIDRPQKTVMRAPFVMFPPPPWSVFHRHAATALRAVARFEAAPGAMRFAAMTLPALRP